jgi:anti-sigma factor RsiW
VLDCKKLLDYLSAYLDGDVDEELRLEIEQHLRLCSRAQAIVHTFEQTIVLHHEGTRAAALPTEVRIRLHAALRRCLEGEE